MSEPISRRAFHTVAGVSVALTVLGQPAFGHESHEDVDDAMAPEGFNPPAKLATADQPKIGAPDPRKRRGRMPRESFTIHGPDHYRKPGVYSEHKIDSNIWVVSDGKHLVVYDATCTHLSCTTYWDDGSPQFACPCHKSNFDTQGSPGKGAKASRPFRRVEISLVDDDGTKRIQVNPRKLFRRERGEWTEATSYMSIPTEG